MFNLCPGGARPCLVEQPHRPKQRRDRYYRARQYEPAEPGTTTVGLGETLSEQALLVADHGGEGGFDLPHKFEASIGLHDPDGGIEADIPTEFHRLGQLFQFALQDRRQRA